MSSEEIDRRETDERRTSGNDDFMGDERRSSADRRSENNQQFSTFFIADRLYGIDVRNVQEVTKSMPITKVPLAPSYVHGLINLRGQIATAISLRELFGLEDNPNEEKMNVVCRVDGLLIAILVDRIGDVLEVADNYFEDSPDTIASQVRKLMDGVYKIPGNLLSIINIGKVSETIQKKAS